MPLRTYRPEIDGIRALSVFAVVFFHLGWEYVPGGFVGVDVFFVISGYLITRILLRALREDEFCLAQFIARRIRRILPASMLMVFVTAAAGAYFLTPAAFQNLGRTLGAHVLMASNCFFSQDQGYFAQSAEKIPLLHTWSLAVEEQFYLILPLLLLVVWRIGSKWLLPTLVGLAIWSLIWSEFKMDWNSREGFFLLTSRAWELLAGSILAVWPERRLGKGIKEGLSVLGLCLIVFAITQFDDETSFPGLSAMVPVSGAVLFILSNQGEKTMVGRLMSVRPMVGLGLLSYSLYLWHWPLCVFTRLLINEELRLEHQTFIFVAALLLAWLSWRYVEKPFRHGPLLKTPQRSFLFAGVGAVALYLMSLTVWLNEGFPKRFSPRMQLMMEDVDWDGDEWTEVDDEAVKFGAQKSGAPDFIIWGDSHGVAAMAGLVQATEKLGMTGWAFLNNGTPPVPGLWRSELKEPSALATVKMNELILEKIIQSGTKDVIVASRWVARCEGYNKVEMQPFWPEYQVAPMAVNELNHAPSIAQSTQALCDGLVSLSRRLREHGIELWLLQQIPESSIDHVAWKFYASTRFPWLYSLEQDATSYEYHLNREEWTMKALRSLPQGTILIIDPTWSFFPKGSEEKLRIYEQRSYYRDDDHLSRAGSEHYLAPVFERVLPELRHQ